MSKELTLNDFVEITKSGSYNIEQEDTWNISIEMTKVTISYDEDFGEITFCCGNHSKDGLASFSFKTELIDTIIEENESYIISFNEIMSSLIITENK